MRLPGFRFFAVVFAVILSFQVGPAFTQGPGVPEGARVVFEDDFSSGPWTGAAVQEGSPLGMLGRVVVPLSYPRGVRDSVRLEREVSFEVQEESHIGFQFRCQGYQHLRVFCYVEGEQAPLCAFVTHFPGGDVQWLDFPLDGNFHNFHWRGGSYRALKPGDRVTRLALELTWPEDSGPLAGFGKITVYSLTDEVRRAFLEKKVAEARAAVQAVPEALAGKKADLGFRLDGIERTLARQRGVGRRPVSDLLRQAGVVLDQAARLGNYYEKTCRALGLDRAQYCVGWETSLRRVTHTNERLRFRGEVPAAPSLALAAREHEAFQLVILPFDSFLREVKVVCSDLQGESSSIGADKITIGRTGLIRTQYSPHSNGTDLGWVPDPIVPLKPGESFAVTPEAELALWVDVYAPAGTPAGEYTGTITIAPANTHSYVVPVKVTVWDYEIPLRGMFRTQGHFAVESVEDFYHRRMDNEWLKQWYAFWLDYRFDPIGQYSQRLTPVFELIPFCLERGLKTINLGGLSGGQEMGRALMDSIYTRIKDNGWLKFSYVYIGDETSDFPLMRRKADMVHTRYPGVKVMIGGSVPRPELIGFIDVWDPIMRPGGVYGFDSLACRAALARGEEMLWYVCISPHPPFPNVQMEDPLVDCRSLFWMTYKYDIMGYEYWGYNFWEQNVTPAGQPRWPEVEWNSYSYDHTNGDGQICYPGPEGFPYPSVRLAVNRDGIEDWEALWIMEDLAQTAVELGLDKQTEVKDLVAQAGTLGNIPNVVVRDCTHYTKDPQVILGHRARVSQVIVALQKHIGKPKAAQYRDLHIRQWEQQQQKSLERNISAAGRRAK